MLDANFIRENPDIVRSGVKSKGLDPSIVDVFLETDKSRRDIVILLDSLRHERKVISEDIGNKINRGEDVSKEKAKVKVIGEEISKLENQLREILTNYESILLRMPNMPHRSVPEGKDESENVVIRTHGRKTCFDFEPLSHWEIAERLGIIDFKRAAKISGSRFYVLKGYGARLERALISWMIDLHVGKHGYVEIFPPFLINKQSMIGTGQLPKFEEDMYKIDGEELYLNPTAEVPVTNLFRDEILSEEELPIKYVAFTTCFRKEAGAAGKDTRGIIRVHQFDKVEMVRFAKQENSYEQLDEIVDNAEDVLRELELPYQIKMMCTGDLGFTASMKLDPEVYMPSQDKYVEVSSCSNFEDFQARRANIRYRTKNGELKFVHTLNGSGLAIGRTMAAILENYQQEDGSVLIPKVLQNYMGVDKISR